MSERILVVDDREGIRTFVAEALESVGYETETAADGKAAADILKTASFDLLVTDLKMPHMDGMALLAHARQTAPEMEVIVLTAHGTIETAVEAVKLGAFDFMTKPLEGPAQLRMVVKRALERRALAASKQAGNQVMIVASKPMERVEKLITKVAGTDATVLLQGESGTGKEVAAREIHNRSKRSTAPFVAVNCAAISPKLVESEMFGHEKGAFTGADEQRIGRFERADGGTLFLDEVGELPMELQAKLLRVLQERKFERVGGSQVVEVNVRLVAATNQDLTEMIANGAFREDLYHRLSVFPVELPPLRERPEDIMPLSEHLLGEIARRLGSGGYAVSNDAKDAIIAHSWPGNVRELSNALERAAIMSDDNLITSDELVLAPSSHGETSRGEVGTLKEIEKEAIRTALAKTDGHRKKAAQMLGIGLRTLYNKLKEYDLE